MTAMHRALVFASVLGIARSRGGRTPGGRALHAAPTEIFDFTEITRRSLGRH